MGSQCTAGGRSPEIRRAERNSAEPQYAIELKPRQHSIVEAGKSSVISVVGTSLQGHTLLRAQNDSTVSQRTPNSPHSRSLTPGLASQLRQLPGISNILIQENRRPNTGATRAARQWAPAFDIRKNMNFPSFKATEANKIMAIAQSTRNKTLLQLAQMRKRQEGDRHKRKLSPQLSQD